MLYIAMVSTGIVTLFYNTLGLDDLYWALLYCVMLWYLYSCGIEACDMTKQKYVTFDPECECVRDVRWQAFSKRKFMGKELKD